MMNWRRFISELKRRKVLRATIGYLAVAWLLIQVASVLFPAFEFPDYALKVLIYVLAFGLPLWMIFSWIYDWTAEGWQKTEELSDQEELKPASPRSVALFSIFLILVVLAGWYFWNMTERRPQREVMSLAVLPFEDLSQSGDNKAFVAGLHDNLITSLSDLNSLRVISRTSTLRYADSDKTMKEIAEELQVEALIETTVLDVGDSVRINMQLIQVFPEERHLWAEIFDRPVNNNILNMFNELTQTVAEKIHLELSPGEEARLDKDRKVDPEALKAFLKGKYQLEKLSPEGFESAQAYFQQAIEIDPEYTAAYAELANSYLYMLQMRVIGYEEAMPKVYQFNRKALELDPDLPEVLYNAWVIKWFEWDWEACEENFREFLDRFPNHALANSFFTHLLLITKRHEEALPYSRRALETDPKNDLVLSLNAGIFALNGFEEQAGEMMLEAFRLNPRSILILRFMEGASFRSENQQGSIEFLQAMYGDIYGLEIDLIGTYEQKGYEAALSLLCEEMIDHMENQDLYIALYLHRLGRYEDAVQWFVHGFERHDVDIPYMFVGDQLGDVKNDPRIIDIANKVGLPRY